MPKITLKCDINQDIQNAIYFIKRKRPRKLRYFLFTFLPKELHYIIKENLPESKTKKIIGEYAKRTYKLKTRAIKEGIAKAKREWESVEKKYFTITDKIFKKYLWPKRKYIGYCSIFGMFPRNVQAKYFYFPPMHPLPKYSNKVIAHEMLHFIFFDYIQKKYGLKEHSRIPKKPDNYIWQVSEAFNNVIEDWKPYNKLIGYKPRPYQGTEKMFKKMSSQWQQKQDIAWLLDHWLK